MQADNKYEDRMEEGRKEGRKERRGARKPFQSSFHPWPDGFLTGGYATQKLDHSLLVVDVSNVVLANRVP